MKTLRSVIDKVHGLRYVIEQLDLKSSLGKRFLLSQPFSVSKIQLETELSNTALAVDLVREKANAGSLQTLDIKLGQVHDIQNTIKRVLGSAILDDVELFEVKGFAILCQEISALNEVLKCPFIALPNLQEVVDILDPDRQNIPHFYIYSSYSNELAQLRAEHKKAQAEFPEKAEEIRLKAVAVEDVIREKLSAQLGDFAPLLQSALELVAHIDVFFAKAKQTIEFGFSKPVISEQQTSYQGLFNPQVKSLLEAQGDFFQPIDIELFMDPCLITGVNMGGKTVLLKTIGLAQSLFQFGFFVPARAASIAIVDKILVSIGDDQSELSSLSSFAAEMMNVNEIVKQSKTQLRLLVLIDELARTTNPEEGKAIVSATLDVLGRQHVRSLISTHYSGLDWSGRRLRVKGLRTDRLTDQLTVKNINDFMDYSLVENDADHAPQQALQIARLLGVDEELLQKASSYLLDK